MKRARRDAGKPALELIEEATHLLRTAPAATLAVYYAGSVPFLIGFLYFWADMSRSPFAGRHSADAALGITVLFFWMKVCHAIFARHLRAQLTGDANPRWTAFRTTRMVLTQIILHSFGLFLVPAALAVAIPFPWVYAFFQNATVFADGDTDTTALFRKSWKHAGLWPWQNHAALAALGAFAFCIYLNWTIACLALPHLIKMLLGIDSVFTQSVASLLNTTFLSAMIALTLLAADPIAKAFYVLRGFYGESVKSGEDLKAEVRRFSSATPAVGLAVLLLCLTPFTSARAAENPAPTTVTAPLSPGDLDHSIDRTIHEDKYTWRMPRESEPKPEQSAGALSRFFNKIAASINDWLHSVGRWIQDLNNSLDRWLRRLFRSKNRPADYGPSNSYGWIMMLEVFLYLLLFAAITGVVLMLYRAWRSRGRAPAAIVSEAIQSAPDVSDENVAADQLPGDGWTRLAHELLERGEYRLAMRAFYLASLAHLAQRDLIQIARAKSNHEYERELRRRAHAFPGLHELFGDNLARFERIWYGRYQADRQVVDSFAANVEKIRGDQ
jgi:hypothetical protein